ncbi:MAG: GAF domain-containing protein [Armatimonadetes bacterium]|nr:GAF domain-containing protein [Armatimonadota bacterium]
MSASPVWNSDDHWSLFSLSELAELGFDAYLQRIAARAAGIFQASGASIFLSDTDPGVYQVRARAGRQSNVPSSATIVRGEGVAGLVAATGVARILGDLAADADFEGIPPADSRDVSSSMVLPLVEPAGDVIGVLNLSRHAGAPAFDPSELEHAKAVAAHVALAASNARLMESLRLQIQEAHESSGRLKAVFDGVGTAVIVLDEQGAVVDCNAPAREYFIDEFAEWIGSNTVVPALRETISDMRGYGRQRSVRVEDSTDGRTWLVHGVPVSSGGLVVTILDVTDHERAVREAERLRRLAEIGQMTAMIAHEIRNPLTGIRSAAQVIREDAAVAGEFLGVIEEEVLKLDALCEEFLKFARPIQLETAFVDLAGPVRDVCERQRSDFRAEDVALTLDVGPDLPKIRLDRRRIEQVVHNLLRNARQACSSGGRVIVRVEPFQLVVEDDGDGMAEDQIKRLFLPFYTTKPEGTGLGLSNVRRILDAHGAKIDVLSRPGEGSRFTVTFDRSQI